MSDGRHTVCSICGRALTRCACFDERQSVNAGAKAVDEAQPESAQSLSSPVILGGGDTALPASETAKRELHVRIALIGGDWFACGDGTWAAADSPEAALRELLRTLNTDNQNWPLRALPAVLPAQLTTDEEKKASTRSVKPDDPSVFSIHAPTDTAQERLNELVSLLGVVYYVAPTTDGSPSGWRNVRAEKVEAKRDALTKAITAALAHLRHAYLNLHHGRVSRRGMLEFADGLIAPQIRRLETALSVDAGATPREEAQSESAHDSSLKPNTPDRRR